MNWLTGRDLITVNVGGSVVNSGDTSITLQSGHGAYLPSGKFYLFFPGSTATGELPEYIYIDSRSTDVLTVAAPPLGNTGGNGRAALANTAPNSYSATSHPAGAVLQLRSTFEHLQQVQNQIDAHVHDGTTGNGPVLGTGAIAALAITTAKIANGAVGTTQIASAAITNALMATDSVDTAQIVANAVTTAKILNANVTTAKIADANITLAKMAANSVDASQIVTNAVTTAKISDANVTLSKMATDSVDTTNIKNNAVTSAKIADANITTTKIADGNVTTAKIADANVTTIKIASGAVTNTQLGAGACTSGALGSDVVVLTGSQTISGVKTFAGAIISSLVMSIGSDATNDMYYRGSGGNLVRLAAPSNANYVLGHASGVPTWGYGKSPDPTKPQYGTNLLVNGGFELWQRFIPSAISVVHNGSGVNQYCADRWLTTFNGTRYVTDCGYTPSPGPSGGYGSRSLYATVAGSGSSGNFGYIIQKIDNIGQYRNLPVTLAIDCYSDTGASLIMDLFDETAGASIGTAVHSNNSTWQRLSASATIPSTCLNLTVRVYFLATGTYYVDNAMLTFGSTAPWTPEKASELLADCQRYYEIIGEGSTGSLIVCGYGAQTFYETISFATTKMASATTTLRGTWAGANVASGPSVGTYDRTGFRLDCTGNNASASFYAHNGAAGAYVDAEINP